MDQLIESFIRVHRRIDSADRLCESFSDLETLALSDPSALSDEDRRRILDFPEPATQAANIAAITSLSKPALIQRAVDSPDQLTGAEVDLLRDRYWLDLTGAESGARSTAAAALVAVSQEHFGEITSRLRKMREPLYEQDEARAIENAENQSWKRLVALAMGPQDEAQAILSRARPWVRQLWDDIKDEFGRRWGYAVFLEPGYEHMDDYLSRREAVLFHARGAICCGDALDARWNLQRLDWPVDADKQGQTLGARFNRLREQFKALVDCTPTKQRDGQGTNAQSGGLEDGILHNTFLVIDRESINSVMSPTGFVDDMWVWAIDPDCESTLSRREGAGTKEGQQQQQQQFGGYMRVRLQQLVNNFFEERSLHAEEHPLARLWEVAAASKNQAFVSVRDDDAGLWGGSRSIGSAMRP
ncbi:hypothetical protein F4802DRAFT_592417 [Xylaria palmicola]|nr:hypothetical protein F4802DRAFT_592417 [Xylaria palmicola]